MKDKLAEYKKKRNFEKTGEPTGKEKTDKSVPVPEQKKEFRFVVQYHEARRNHYDFRLAYGGVLLSWAVPKGPSFDPVDKRLAVKVEDHPLEYADFEGIIPKGSYGGGTVMLWDEGTYCPLVDFTKGLKEGSLKFTLFGKRLCGSWALVRMKGKENETDDNWLLIKENDMYKQTGDGISAFRTSVRTARTVQEIAQDGENKRIKNPPVKVAAALCKSVNSLHDSDDMLYEVKYDGYRIFAYAENGRVTLKSRNGKEYTTEFSSVVDALAKMSAGRSAILDGEMIVPDEQGKSDFGALQAHEKTGEGNIVYMAFDLLALDGDDLRPLPLIDRKKKLDGFLMGAPACVCASVYVLGQGKACADAAKKAGLEGVVGKKINAPYRGGRGGDWIKYKCYRKQEFVLGGYTRTPKSEIGALLLGVYAHENSPSEKLRYAGRAGTGLPRKNERELVRLLSEYAADSSPFDSVPRASGSEKIFWLRPELVGEVRFAEWTREDRLRQASFKGLRTDKDAKEVVREDAPCDVPVADGEKKEELPAGEPVVCHVNITHPDKIVYPSVGVTKRDVAKYYEAAAPRMLAVAADRVMSVVRCHNGVGGSCFFNKHPTAASRASAVTVRGSEKTHTYFYVANAEELIGEVQLGALEFHIWGSRVSAIEKPDYMVFDLDPDEGVSLARVREGVSGVKKTLDELGLRAFLKTSGGKGYHVIAPFPSGKGWEDFRAFARSAAKLLEERNPELYTSNIRKEKRKNKIFVDWGRNTRGATSVAPYSLRARVGAKVSMPIGWNELNNIPPDGIDIFAAREMLSSPDPWKEL